MQDLSLKNRLPAILIVSLAVMISCLIPDVKALGQVRNAKLLMHNFDKISTKKIRIYQPAKSESPRELTSMKVGEIEAYYVPGGESDYVNIRYHSYSNNVNIALESEGCNIQVSSNSTDNLSEKLNDGVKGIYLAGNQESVWESAETDSANWIELVFPHPDTVNIVAIFCKDFPKTYKIEYLKNEEWQIVRNLEISVEEPAPLIWSFKEWEFIQRPESRLSDLLVLQSQNARQHVASERMWYQKQQQIKAKILHILGPFPSSRCDLNPKIIKEEEFKDYIRKKISFVSEPGDTIPAFLLIPKNLSEPTAAILALHQTIQFGKNETVGI
jgi:hypothetical protein